MKNKKTIFRKYLWTNMITILLGFVILGVTIFFFVTKYWEKEKQRIFAENAHYISNLVANNSYVESNNIVWVNSDSVKIFIDTLSESMNIDIFITDRNGNVVISSIYNKSDFVGGVIPISFMEHIFSGRHSCIDDMNGFYKSKKYIIGEAVKSSYGREETVIGGVITAMDQSFLVSFKKDMLKIFLMTFFIAFLLSFWAVRRVSKSLVRPIKEMSEAASFMARGDFSKRVNVKGEDEISDLGISFNNMASSLHASDSVRRNFIANVSHELKTPMTTISGFVDGILDGVIEEKDREKYLKIVSKEIKRLSRLVKKMLDLSRIDTEKVKINISNVDLFKELLDVLISFERNISEKNIEIRGMQECKNVVIKADRDMIHQVVYNLVENAIKFNTKNGFINTAIFDDNEFCYLKIENTGEEIPSNEKKFIFDRFYKTDKSRSKDKIGLGLGLYIVKKIVLLHGGNIKIFNSSNKTTEFLLKLPKKNK